MLSLFLNKKITGWLFGCMFLAFSGSAFGQARDPWWGQDKGLHFAISAGIASTSYAGMTLVTPRSDLRIIVAATMAISAGIAKEVYDNHTHGDASARDLTWDLVGTTTGTVMTWLIDRYIF
jgi:putative lipoprotein